MEMKETTYGTNPEATVEARLKRMEDLRAMEACICYYTDCADLGDAAGMTDCFAEQAVLRWAPDREPAARGRTGIYHELQALMGRTKAQKHYCTNFQFRVYSGCQSAGVCNLYAWQVWNDGTITESYGHYMFEMVLEDGAWRIQNLCLAISGKTENGTFRDPKISE